MEISLVTFSRYECNNTPVDLTSWFQPAPSQLYTIFEWYKEYLPFSIRSISYVDSTLQLFNITAIIFNSSFVKLQVSIFGLSVCVYSVAYIYLELLSVHAKPSNRVAKTETNNVYSMLCQRNWKVSLFLSSNHFHWLKRLELYVMC